MSTEAKMIDPAGIERDAWSRLTAFRQEAEPRVTRAMLDVGKLARNRRLLEAGERLEKVCMRLEEFTTPSKRDWENAAVTDEFWSIRQEATNALAAYQEAAKP